jgi:hypothetical protein
MFNSTFVLKETKLICVKTGKFECLQGFLSQLREFWREIGVIA